MLARSNEMLAIENDFGVVTESEREKLVGMVNRGVLHKPSDIVYITCIHAWSMYKYIQCDENIFRKMMSVSPFYSGQCSYKRYIQP